MKITIDGEPKEIAALEQALKGSNDKAINFSLDLTPKTNIEDLAKALVNGEKKLMETMNLQSVAH